VIDGVELKPVYPQVSAAPDVMAKELRHSNGQGGWLRSVYKYEGYMVHAQGRGSLGFAKMQMTNPQTNVITTSLFSQTYPYVRMLKQFLVSHAGVTLNDTTNTLDRQAFMQVNGSWTYMPYVKHSKAASHDLDGSDLGVIDTENGYTDGWGNLTDMTMSTTGANVALSSVVKTGFKNDSAAWLLGLPTLVEATKTNAAGASLKRTVSYDYHPATGALLSQVIEPNADIYRVTTVFDRTLNPFGLVNAKTESWIDPSCASIQIPAGLDPGCTTLKSRTWNTGFDPKGRFATSTDNPLKQKAMQAFDPATGASVSTTDTNSQTTTRVVDAFGRIVVERRPDGNETRTYVKACQGMCPFGAAVAQISDSFHGAAPGSPRIGMPQVDYIDSAGHVRRKLRWGFDGTAIVTDLRYDDAGRLLATDQPRYDIGTAGTYLASRQEYDDLNRITSVFTLDEALAERETKTRYQGLVTTFTNPKVSDGKLQQRVETRNVGKQLIQVEDAKGKLTKFDYEPFGKLSNTTDPSGNVIKVSYDLLGRRIGLQDPDLGLVEYKVDPVGQTWLQVSPRQRAPYPAASTSFKFDLLGRMRARFETDLKSYWEYDPVNGIGSLAEAYTGTAANKDYRKVHAYDAQGRPLQQTQYLADGVYTSSVTYDAWGRPITQTYQRKAGAVSAAPKVFDTRYNNKGFAARLERGGLVLSKVMEQDAAGRVTAVALGNGLIQARCQQAP
jgi:YD repeat-containing protein